VRRITADERRARLGVRHGLASAARAPDPVGAARAVVALHATDPASVFLSARARMQAPTAQAIEHALYVERSVVRILGMRRTVFVVPADLVEVVHAACTQALVPAQRRRLVDQLENAGVAADGAAWLRDAEEAAVLALAGRGEATAAELSADVPALREQIAVAQDKPYAARQGVSSRVLFLLAAQGRIVRGRPLGSWTSTLYRWSPLATWLPGPFPELPVEVAGAELVRRWLRAFGPGTFADLKWWTGWTVGLLKRVLAEVAPVEVQLDDAVGLVLPGDEGPAAAPAPWVALLPALDPTVMGWFERTWFLGTHRTALFDTNGNAGPTVWWGGRAVGGWAQRKNGEIVHRLLEDVGAEAEAAVAAEGARLQAWLGAVRFVPRFRTPLERGLTA